MNFCIRQKYQIECKQVIYPLKKLYICYYNPIFLMSSGLIFMTLSSIYSGTRQWNNAWKLLVVILQNWGHNIFFTEGHFKSFHGKISSWKYWQILYVHITMFKKMIQYLYNMLIWDVQSDDTKNIYTIGLIPLKSFTQNILFSQ